MIETDDVRAFFLSVNDFALAATFTPSGGVARTVNGIYDDPYLAADAGGSVEFAATDPVFTARTVDLADAAFGDALTVSGIDYIVREVMPDGTGMTTLALEKV